MFNPVLISLQTHRLEIMNRGIGAYIPEIEESLCSAFRDRSISLHCGTMSAVAIDNVQAAFDFADRINASGYGDKVCLFVHGSTGRGAGSIVPNIDFTLSKTPKGPRMHTKVIQNCRDDVDLVLVANTSMEVIGVVQETAGDIAQRGISLTVNIISMDSILEDLKNPGSPAMRRILLFNHPKLLLGGDVFQTLTNVATANESWLDIPHEMDFRILMTLADILLVNGYESWDFGADELLMHFPTFYLACDQKIHIGFPLERKKIKNDGQQTTRQEA